MPGAVTSVGSSKGYRKGGGYGGYGSSKGFGGSGSSGGSGGEDSNKKITPISEVDPMFEPLFEEGQCYIVSNFGIAENGGRLLLLPHRYKISFYKSTIVTRIEPFDNNTHGFVLEPYNRLLDLEHHQYYEQDAVGELFYLRILLNKVRGHMGCDDLKEYDDVVYPTYREACYARGLLEDDKEYIDGLLEARLWGMGDYLRSFFVMLLMMDSMSRPDVVWQKTWHFYVAEDVMNVGQEE
ncbi:hypothetical protein Tco_0696977 [Tanacetum coccineum]